MRYAMKDRFTKDGRVFTRWSGKSLQDMCEDPVDKTNYFFTYGYFSKYVHPSLLTADEYILGKDGDNVVVQIGSNPRLVQETIRSTSILFLEFLGVLNEEYKMSFDAKLNAFSDDFKNLRAEDKSKVDRETQ